MDVDYVIRFTDRISLRRMDSLWYGGNVAEVRYNGYVFSIEAIGDIYAALYPAKYGSEDENRRLAYVKDKRNGGGFNEMLPYLRSDKALRDASGEQPVKYCLEMEHGNWWECFITDPNGDEHDLMWDLGGNSIFDAIAETIAGMDEAIKNLEEEKC